MSAAAAFAVLDQIRANDRAAAADAEFRRCVMLQALRHAGAVDMAWPRVQQFYEAQRQEALIRGHDCNYGGCDALALKQGEQFADPANPSRVYRAEGTLWVCAYALRRHICLAKDPCEFSYLSSAGITVCQMTGLDKGGVIVSVPHYATREQQRSAATSAITDAAAAAASSSSSDPARPASDDTRKRAAPAKKEPRKKSRSGPVVGEELERQLSAPVSNSTNEIRSVCETLFSVSRGITKVCRTALRTAVQETRARIATRLATNEPLGFAELASLVTVNTADALHSVLAVAPSMRDGVSVRPADIEYLVSAVARILHVLRLTPKISSHNNAVSAKGARTVDMCVPILMRLRDGVVGRVTIDHQTNERQCRIMTQSDADADAVGQDPAACVLTYVLVPAHPNLRHVLPNAVPYGYSESIDSLYANMMRHRRCIDVAFDSVLSNPDVDPEHFCLSRHMRLRVDLLSYVSHQ